MQLDSLFTFKNSTANREDLRIFDEERTSLNLKRLDIISIISAFFFFALTILDIFVLKPRYPSNIGYRNLYWGHILMLSIIGVYFILKKFSKKLFSKNNYCRIICFSCYYFALVWCTLSAVNGQLTNKKIGVYLVAVFIVSSYAIFTPLENGLMLFSTYILLLISMILLDSNFQTLLSNIINSTMMVFLAYAFSIVNYKMYFYNITSRETIRRNSEELALANSELSNEIATVNELYAEKDILLNKAIEYENLRTNFFSNISHELRTPINVILCAQQILCLGGKDNNITNPNIKYLKMIKQNCYRLLKLTNNIIDINKIDSGRFDLNLGNYDIVKIVEDICMSVADYIKSKDISFVFDTEIEEKVIACDPDMVERILLNLLSNAIKFTYSGGSVTVNISNPNDSIEITVQDTGIGIPKNKQFLVFERFVQLDNSLSRNYEGSGIGLALVRNLVEMHDGAIRLVSEEGSGSKFIVSLPCKTVKTNENPISENKDSTNIPDKVQKINVELSDIYFD